MSGIVNIELAEKVLKQVKENPEQHDQHNWITKSDCGTRACLAGWTVHIAGLRPGTWIEGPVWSAWSTVSVGGVERNIDRVAAELLGMDEESADRIFYTLSNEHSIELFTEAIEEAKANAAL